ncbi:MAG: DUF6064 family protein [Candidatus Lokiarchaeota archaeon]|nr:DUF6064 family protein [Candidatus Harpocratesius repetitus]
MIPASDWWNIISNYGLSIFPMQFINFALGFVLVVYFLVKKNELASRLLKCYFVYAFLWIGIIFFFLLGKDLPAYIIQTSLFSLLGILFAIDFKWNRIVFKIPQGKTKKTLYFVLLVLVFAYPLIGYLLGGHSYPKLIILGSYPCPTTALALVLISGNSRKIDWKIFLLLLIWAIPFPIFIQIPQFGVYEDIIMLLSGLYSAGLWIYDKKPILQN